MGEVTIAADSNALLREFAEHRSETAFATLVRQHLNLVYSVALRRCGGRTGLAEDICQAVFIDLARKARTLPGDVLLAGWLHQHTCFVAATMLRTENRRRHREEIAMQLQSLTDHTDWSRLAPLLDEALLELSGHDRDSLVLRFLEQRPFAEVGAHLGLSENAARMRVDRALDKLHAKLTKRGVTSTASALALALAGPAVTAAPAGLAPTITTAALAAVATTTTTLGISTLMAATKLKLTAGALLVALTGTALVMQHRSLQQQNAENTALRQQVAQLTKDARETAARDAEELARLRQPAPELLRLRGEVAQLRKQVSSTDRAASAAVKATTTPAANTPEEAEEASRTFAIRRMTEAKMLVMGFHLFAAEHDDQFPDSLEAAAARVKSGSNLGEMAVTLKDLQTEDYELMYLGSSKDVGNPASAILLRERAAWQGPKGDWWRTYGFADGHSEVHHTDDGDFSAWEAQHQVEAPKGPPPGQGGN